MTDAASPQRHVRNSTPPPGRSHLPPPDGPGVPSDEPARHPSWNLQRRAKFVSGVVLPRRRDHADVAIPLGATQHWLAQAVGQHLTTPGSISPQLQLTLIMAARVHHPDFDPPAPADDHWTPFRQSGDRNPHVPLTASDDQVVGQPAAPRHAWWHLSPAALGTTQ